MMTRLEDDPLRESVYFSNMDNYTGFERAQMVADEETMRIRFSVWGGINVFVAIITFLLIVSILRSQKVRSNAFNLYVLGTSIPDFAVSFLCAWTCLLSAPGASYYSDSMCGFQSFYLVWGFASNCWINGVICYQIHKLLRCSNARKRYFPPRPKEVIKQVLAVYAYAMCLGLIGAWNISWLPLKTFAYYGLACFPMEDDLLSTFIFWLIFVPAFIAIPSLYSVYVLWQVYSRGLMPPKGRRRTLAIFFLKVVFVYIIMWIPFLVLGTLGNYVPLSSWYMWTGAAWSHLQVIVSAAIAITKKDIREAFLNFVTCGTYTHSTQISEQEESYPKTSWQLSTGSQSNRSMRGNKPENSIVLSFKDFASSTRLSTELVSAEEQPESLSYPRHSMELEEAIVPSISEEKARLNDDHEEKDDKRQDELNLSDVA